MCRQPKPHAFVTATPAPSTAPPRGGAAEAESMPERRLGLSLQPMSQSRSAHDERTHTHTQSNGRSDLTLGANESWCGRGAAAPRRTLRRRQVHSHDAPPALPAIALSNGLQWRLEPRPVSYFVVQV